MPATFLFATAIAMPSSPLRFKTALAIEAALAAPAPEREWLCFAPKLLPDQGMDASRWDHTGRDNFVYHHLS
jgi:hypothetical protein